jgi:hypothetical protein
MNMVNIFVEDVNFVEDVSIELCERIMTSTDE